MDELIIGEDKYVSSKRAAEMTGYAKDYIGQLCREGRVEARLVGRNWYVLESSLQNHRFGPQEKESSDVPRGHKTAPAEEWESPRYEAEEAKPVPLAQEFEPTEEGRPDETHHVTQMQEAWKDWFERERPRHKEEPGQELNQEEVEAVPISIIKAEPVKHEEVKIVHERVRRDRSGTASAPLARAILVAIAILAVAVTYIGSGFLATRADSSWSATVINALEGSREYNR